MAEQYLRKTLSANDVRTILFISDRLAFSEDLIDYLIQYCVDHGKKDLRYIEKVAISWAQQGVTTPGQAAGMAGKYDRNVVSQVSCHDGSLSSSYLSLCVSLDSSEVSSIG